MSGFVAAMLAGALLGSSPGVAPDARAEVPEGRASTVTPAALERQYGIRVDQIAVTAAGGLVDLRFTVLDPRKASAVLRHHGPLPRLASPDGGAVLEAPHGAMRSIRLRKDAACFVLYPNARGAIRSGSPVSVLFGDLRLEPVAAR
jgi:hypothetical protein